MDLLLTHGYFLHEDPKELQIMKPYAPLGLLYLSSHLRARGFDVEIYDSTFGSREELFRILETEPPATLGIYANLMTRAERAGDPAARAWRADGAWCWAVRSRPIMPTSIWPPARDVVVAGEGELALEAILRGDRRSNRSRASYFARPTAHVDTGPARLLPISTRSPGRIANASISTATCAPGASITARVRSR